MQFWIGLIKVISLFATGGFGVLALLTKYKSDSGKITKWGKIALGGIILSTSFSLILFGLETYNAKAAAEKAKVEANATAKLLQNILNSAQTTVEQQKKSLEETERIKSGLAETLKQQELNLKKSDYVAQGIDKSLDSQRAVLAGNEELIKEQTIAIQQLNNLSLDRNLLGVEISYKPTERHWARIAKAYQKIESPVTGIPYSAATMIAERVGDYWKIDFDPVSVPQGIVQFAPVSTNQQVSKAFDTVIREALIDLWIKWGDDIETRFQPDRGYYPSAIVVSEQAIKLILLSPDIKLNLGRLNANRTVKLRCGEYHPSSIRFHSLDPTVMFDQTFNLNWKKEEGNSYLERTRPYVSGPLLLRITFKTVSQ